MCLNVNKKSIVRLTSIYYGAQINLNVNQDFRSVLWRTEKMIISCLTIDIRVNFTMSNIEIQIAAEKTKVCAEITYARMRQLKTIEIAPQSTVPGEVIMMCVNLIEPSERIRITLPKAYTHFGGVEECDWDTIREILEDVNGGGIRDDVFVTLRYDDAATKVIVDIYHI